MKTITVQVREDHLENLARTKPMTALAELMWNALDAESTELRVEFVENELGGIEMIRIVDNGHGLHYDDAFIVFQSLGGSWKRGGSRTMARKRVLHGKFGKGRFRAFSLGNQVAWKSVYQEVGHHYSFSIDGTAMTLGQFRIANAAGAPGTHTGMTVEITNVSNGANLLRGVKAVQEVTDLFALYLRQYPDVRIVYDGIPIDAANAQDRAVEYVLDELVTENGDIVQSTLTVVEWHLPGKRGLFLCDEHGFLLADGLPRLHFRGFSYTAYLKSAHCSTLDRQGLLQAGELSPDLRLMMDSARAKLREHFTLREVERAQDTLAGWREAELYPYSDDPKSDADANERRIFDIYATHLNQIFPDFGGNSTRTQGLVLRLLQELVRTEPIRVARVLDDLLDFPEEKEEQVIELVRG